MAANLSFSIDLQQNLETYGLIWLDASVDKTQHNREVQTKLRSIINHLVIFDDAQPCRSYIETLPKDDRSVLIVSGQFGETIVPEIWESRAVAFIYVYCANKRYHEVWAKKFPKVKGVFNELNELLKQFKTDQTTKEHAKVDEKFVFNLLEHVNEQDKSTRDINGEFLYVRLLIDCLVAIPSNSGDEKELIAFCNELYKGNPYDLRDVKDFQMNYSSSTAINWYTRECFLFRLLNKALRTEAIHVLYLFRMVIADIQEQLHANRCPTVIHVYRAQVLSKEELQSLQKSPINTLIAVNSFFSTTADYQCARGFLNTTERNNTTEDVIFDITADPSLQNIPAFADITDLGCHPHEKEVLFMIGSIFKLKKISREDDGIWMIHMELCSLDQKEKLHQRWRQMKKQLPDGHTDLLKLGQILRGMKKLDDAKACFNRLLKKLSKNHAQVGSCNFELGRIADDEKNYIQSLQWFQKALRIKQDTLEPDDPSIASTYGNMGNIHQKMGNRDEALEFYTKAMDIYNGKFGDDHLFVASCWNNMGIIYQAKGMPQHALNCYQRALDIRKEHCDPFHLHIATSHHNLAAVFASAGKHATARKHLQETLPIYQADSATHPRILPTLVSIADLCERQMDFEEALTYYRQAQAIHRATNTSLDLEAMKINYSIARVSRKLQQSFTNNSKFCRRADSSDEDTY